MPSLSASQIATAARAGGFLTNEDVVKAVAIALAESGGNPSATNHNTNGSTDYGLWQINSVHASILRSGSWSNPTDNARMAYQVFTDAGNSFTPWTTYTSGRYVAFLSVARRAAYGGSVSKSPPLARGGTGNGGSVTPKATQAGFSVPNPVAGLVSLATLVTNPATWLRVAMFLAGIMFLWWGIRSVSTWDNKLEGITKDIGMAAL